MLSVVLSCLIGSLLTFLYSGFDIQRLKAVMHGHAQYTRHPSLDIDDNTPPLNFDCSQRHDNPRKHTHDADEGLPHPFSYILASGLDSKGNRPSDNPRRQTMQLHRTPITKHLYLSDFLTARTPRNLQHLDITHVLSAIQADLSKHFDGGILVIHVPTKDTPNANLLMWFNRVVEFIARVLDSNRNHKVPVCPALMNTDIFARYTACKAYHVLRSSCARIRWLKLAWAHLEAIEYV